MADLENCARCGKAIEGIMIGDAGGPSHPLCYYLAHPFVPVKTFREVLTNCDDQVIVRELLSERVPGRTQDQIIRVFNERMTEAHRRRLQLHSQHPD